MQPKHSGLRSLELLWPKVLLRKWLNISSRDTDYAADSDHDEFGDEDYSNAEEDGHSEVSDNLPRLGRRTSETFRSQYINTKEIRICVGTWNVGGRLPHDIDIEEWLNIDDPSDIYVLGLQEIVPLNAGKIFGPEDNRPALKWEKIIRETLSRVHPAKKSFKSYSDPPSPSKFKPCDDTPEVKDEVSLGSDSDGEEEVYPLDEEPGGFYEVKDEMVYGDSILRDNGVSNGDKIHYPDKNGEEDLKKQFSSPKRLDRLLFQSGIQDEDDEIATNQMATKLSKTQSGTERIGLCWPEPPLNLLAQRVFERPYSFKPTKSFDMSKSFKTNNSFNITGDGGSLSDAAALEKLDLESIIQRRRRPEYARIISKQMIGIFLTIWVRKDLCEHIQNLKVSRVGVGVMGYLGNKGAVSVSMSIYQTLFCFICTHLTSGEKEGDQLKRNTDVKEIHRRTQFRSDSGLGVPKSIHDHERIIWLGDLNYRINLSYKEIQQLISKKEWAKLVENDQLVRELKKGRVFDGWCEGILNFPPTYKYEMNSDNYSGQDPKMGRRNPAWCDRILSFGKGIKLMNYRRSELKLSDHRPVTAIYNVEVEVFSPRKLQRALTFTDAEVQNEEILIDNGMNAALSHLRLEKDLAGWGR